MQRTLPNRTRTYSHDDHCSDVHAAYLAALNFAFAKVTTTDEVLKTVSA
jgi:hypothetical protein